MGPDKIFDSRPAKLADRQKFFGDTIVFQIFDFISDLIVYHFMFASVSDDYRSNLFRVRR